MVKLGSAIVTADDGTLRADVLDSVCEQVVRLHDNGEDLVLVTSGAVACGMRVAGMGQRPSEVGDLQATSALGQGELFAAYRDRLASGGVKAAQVLLTSYDISARVNYLNAKRTLRRLTEWRAVPVINENDTTATDEITFGDNDFLASQVAILVEARLLVLLTDTAGLHTADPRVESSASLVEVVDDLAELEEYSIDQRKSAFGSGGMRSKVAAAGIVGSAGMTAVICDGTAPGTLLRAVEGNHVGTLFRPHPERTPSFKLWLRYAKPSRGVLEVDAGAAKALQEKGASLLPVGVTAVAGDFVAGDAVEVSHTGDIVGKGIVTYSAAELDIIKGKSSAEAAELLPGGNEEAIHRDHFLLT